MPSLVIPALLIALLQFGCGKSPTDEKEFESDILASREVDGWLLEITIEKPVYSERERIEFSFIITNTSKKPFSRQCPDACHFFWNIYRDDMVIYSLSKHIGCAQWITDWGLGPGESRTYNGRWDQTDDSGNKVSSGKYEIEAYVCALPYMLKKYLTIQ